MICYFQAIEAFSNEIIIKKSRFITNLIPIENADDATDAIKRLNKKYSDATHNCYAFIANDIATEQRFSDDGEPQGTAGVPMLEVLKKRRIYKTLAVVTRYFGGIKLGAGGLVGAYSESVSEALDKAILGKFLLSDILSAEIEYSFYGLIRDTVCELGGDVIDVEYENIVKLKFAIDCEKTGYITTNLSDITLGKINIKLLKRDYHCYKL